MPLCRAPGALAPLLLITLVTTTGHAGYEYFSSDPSAFAARLAELSLPPSQKVIFSGAVIEPPIPYTVRGSMETAGTTFNFTNTSTPPANLVVVPEGGGGGPIGIGNGFKIKAFGEATFASIQIEPVVAGTLVSAVGFEVSFLSEALSGSMTLDIYDAMGVLHTQVLPLSSIQASNFFGVIDATGSWISKLVLTASANNASGPLSNPLVSLQNVRISPQGNPIPPPSGVVPEPSSLALSGLASIGLLAGWRRSSRHPA